MGSDLSTQPRILVITPDLPYPIRAGGQMRMASFVEALSNCAHVHVACRHPTLPPETLAWRQKLGITMAAAPRQSIARWQQWCERLMMVLTHCNLTYRNAEMAFFEREKRKFSPHLVWLETPYLIRYALAWHNALPIIVNYWGTSQGAERDFRSACGRRRIWEWLRWYAACGGESKYAPMLNAIVAVSEIDAGHFRNLAPNVMVTAIPNAIMQSERDYSTVPLHPQQLVFTGDLSYRPNVDAAIYFTKEILPQIRTLEPAAYLKIAGRNPLPEVQTLAMPGVVEIAGFVPDIRETIAESAVYVLPMRLGSGIRSKLFDVFPLGKAIVTTGIGAEGLELRHRENCLIADTPQTFAEACVELLRNPPLATQIGVGARRLALNEYSQTVLNRKIADLLKTVLEPQT